MSGGVVYWYDLVTLQRKGNGHEPEHDQRGVLVRMPNTKRGVRRADGTVLAAAGSGLRVVDRSTLRPGDIVASESDVGGQIGVVTGVSRALDLVHLDDGGRRQQGVVSRPPEELRRVTALVSGDYVVSGPWLGRVAEVSLHVDVAFDDGALCTLAGAERKLVGAQAEEDNSYRYDLRNRRQMTGVPFYPGQRVVGRSPSAFQASRWIKGHWKPSRVRGGTVSRVDVAGVLVHWVASMHLGTNKEILQASAPPAWQPNPDKLALLPYPASVWYVGDRCFLRTPPPSCHGGHQHLARRTGHGVIVDDDDDGSPSARRRAPHGRPLTRRQHGNKRRLQVQPDLRRSEWERPMSVAGTRTTADVLWQDGTRQCGVPSPSLVLFNRARNDYDFFPGQHVVSRPAAGEHSAAAARSGVVRSQNCRDRTVCVSWFPAGEDDDGCGETIVSAYDVARDSAANFFYGDVVVRLRHPTEIAADEDLSWVGHVVDLCEGTHIQVKWGDGDTSKVLPREIVAVKPQRITEMLQELGDWLDDNGDLNGEKEREREQGMGLQAAAQDPVAAAITGAEGGQDSSDGESDTEDNPALTARTTMDRVCSAARALIRAGGDFFALGGMWNSREAVAEESASSDVVEAATLVSESDGDASTSTTSTCEVNASRSFPQFDIVQRPPDHHFIDNVGQGTLVGRKWTKRVQKEWKILENDLPDTIYVRAFEDRMDLLRVVMVGASGTPYHDGLFFFDMHLPPSYPAEPPLVNYRSFGLRVNPNLYPSGTVCLSLLNTFGGEGVELWSPEASNILQVVVSIQGLVLTAQPYYNEPAVGAHAGTAKGLRNNLPYSENTYLLNIQTMLHLLRRPPAGFEEFVRDHFHRRGQHVIRACEAYQDGCLVGTLDEEGHPTEDSKKRPCSAGFKLALLNLLPGLVKALDNNNIDAQGCKRS